MVKNIFKTLAKPVRAYFHECKDLYYRGSIDNPRRAALAYLINSAPFLCLSITNPSSGIVPITAAIMLEPAGVYRLNI